MSSSVRVDNELENIYKDIRSTSSSIILDLAIAFGSTDKKQTGSVKKSEFLRVLKNLSISIRSHQIDLLASAFEDINDSDLINYTSFLDRLKADCLNDRRLAVVYDLFYRLKYKKSETVDILILGQVYDASKHYLVKMGKADSDQLEKEFKSLTIKYAKHHTDSVLVDSAAFVKFWEYFSPTVENDSHFEYILVHCFRCDSVPIPGQINTSDVDRFERSAMVKRSRSPKRNKEITEADPNE